jgi:hypothetical protein
MATSDTPAIPLSGAPSSQSSFTQKIINITVKLAANPGTNQPNTFANTTSDTVTLSGLRTSVRIQNSGTPGGSLAQIDIWGLTIDLMDQLSTLGMYLNLIPRNSLTITAGDAVSGMGVVFSGLITNAYGDFNASPKVPFHFDCNTGLADAVLPAGPSSFPQSTDVGTIMSGIAKQLGYGFENNGVNITLPPTYLPGSYQTQWQKVKKDANIEAALVVGGSDPSAVGGLILAIWPKGGSRGGAAFQIAPPPVGSMIGYPSYTQQGIIVKNVFNPQIGFGGQIVVSGSLLKKANGTWIVHKLDHALDSLVDHGLWESTIYGYGANPPIPIVAPV